MSWRTVIISSRCKLDLKMGYLVVRGQEVRRIFLDEIALLLIENPAVAMTGCLLAALTEKKIKVIFCNQKHMPQSELIPVQGSYDSARKIKAQISWDETVKGCVWREIIRQKIYQQAVFLSQLGYTREKTCWRAIWASWNSRMPPTGRGTRQRSILMPSSAWSLHAPRNPRGTAPWIMAIPFFCLPPLGR